MKLTSQEARIRFERSASATLGTVDESGRPHLVPVTYVVLEDDNTYHVYIAIDDKPKQSVNLRRLRNIMANPRVSLLVSEYSDNWEELWWVRADGTALVSGFGELPDGLLAAFQSRYPWYLARPPGGPVIDVCVTTWSGWSFAA